MLIFLDIRTIKQFFQNDLKQRDFLGNFYNYGDMYKKRLFQNDLEKTGRFFRNVDTFGNMDKKNFLKAIAKHNFSRNVDIFGCMGKKKTVFKIILLIFC